MSITERVGGIVRRRVQHLSQKDYEERLLKDMSPEKIKAGQEALEFLIRNGSVSPDSAGEVLAASHEALEILYQKSVTRREGRRKLLKGIGIGALILTPAAGAVATIDQLWGASAYRREEEARRRLETNSTLGLEPSIASFSGWSVRYATPQLARSLVQLPQVTRPMGSDTIIKFASNKIDELEDTGIFIKEHVRTSDNTRVGKLAIATRVISPLSYSPSYNISDEFVLRTESTADIDAKTIVFENALRGEVKYFSVSRSNPHGTERFAIQLRAMQKVG